MSCVLDSSALVAFLKSEPGKDFVAAGLSSAVMSAVNVAESMSYLVRKGASFDQARRRIGEIDISIIPLNESQALRAGELLGTTRRWGLSLGDCACLALAEARDEEVWTGDRRWLDAGLPIKIKLIR